MNIQSIRSQYPQYSDLSDQQLADALHNKYYSDMPKNQFYSKIGLSNPGIADQIGQGILKNITTPVKMTSGQLVPGENSQGVSTEDQYNPFKEITSNPYKPQMPNSIATEIGESIPGIAASFIPGAGAEEAAGAALSKVPEFFGSNLAKKALQSAAGGAASAPLMGINPKTGAEWGAALGPAGELVSNIGKLPAKILGGKMGYEEAKQAIDSVPKGIKLPLGQIVDSPRLNRIYQGASSIPFSGTAKPYDQLNSYLQDGIAKLTENSPENVPDANQHVFDMYKNAYDQSKQNTHNAFSELSDAADQLGDRGFDKTKLNDAISDARKEVNPKLVNDTASKQYKPIIDMLDDFEKTDIPNFQTANHVGQVLNDLYRQNSAPENGMMRRYINKLKSGLEDSIDDNASKYPELSELRQKANQARQYQAEFEKTPSGAKSPFFKINNNPNASDTGKFIDSYVKSSLGNKDNSSLLDNLLSKVDEPTKNLVAERFINPRGESSLSDQVKNLSKLSPGQRSLLFGGNKPVSDEILKLSKMFPEGKNPGFVPKTGFTGSKITGGVLGALHPELVGLPIGAQIIQRALRSNALKNIYLNSLKSQSREIPDGLMQSIRSLSLQGDNKNGN